MQYQGKLMIQPWENDKNPIFRPNLGPKNFFSWVLPFLVNRQCFKLSSYAISRKTNEPNKKNDKKPNLGPVLAQLWVYDFFLWVLLTPVVRHCSKLSSYAT